MRRLTLKDVISLFLIAPIVLAMGSCTQDALLEELDGIIADSSPYDARFHARLDSLKGAYAMAADGELRFQTAGKIFDLYRNYRIDSALIMAKQMEALASQLPESYRHKAQMRYADALNKFGRHGESLDVLDRIPRTDSVRSDSYFYYLYHTATLSLVEESVDRSERDYYRRKMLDYKDTLLGITKRGSIGNLSNYAGLLAEKGRRREAVRLLEDYYQKHYAESEGVGTGQASLEYQIAELHLSEKDTARAVEFLKRASISDLKESKRVYKSLQRLAVLLYRQGDIDHAYNYIMKSLQDINEGNARYRVYDITAYLPIITSAYDRQVHSAGKRQVLLSIVLVALLVVLVVAYWMVRRRNRSLAEARRKEEERNAELSRLAADLRLSNAELKESDRIKVEYIAMLFNTYSENIKRQESFRRSLARKIASRQSAQALKMLGETEEDNDDFKRFIMRFDTIFLSIFPNFVDDFNNLLRPEERVCPKKGELLTPELRIYALIRLGIKENARIADFLHYSLQTVYNYRQRMRNKALVKGQSLSEQMRRIAGE